MIELESDWAELYAQTKEQLVREHIELIGESRSSTEAMNRAKAKIDELRTDGVRLRATIERLLEVVMLDSASLNYGRKRRDAIEEAGYVLDRQPA